MENKNLKKNKQISQTMSETRKKRQNQICRVFHVKIQENKLSKLQKEQLQMIFVEGKRYKNHIIGRIKSIIFCRLIYYYYLCGKI